MKPKPRKPRRGPEWSPGTRREVIRLRKAGMPIGKIEEETGVKANTAGKIWARRNNGFKGKSTPHRGRPPNLDENACQNLQNYVQNHDTRRQPLSDISASLNLNVSSDTIYRALIG